MPATTTTEPVKHAVILSGGGAKGAYEIGVMKALFPGRVTHVDGNQAIEPAVFSGTSVGSFNAAYLTSRPSLDAAGAVAELEGIWRNRIAGSSSRPNGVLRFRANPLELMDIERLAAEPLAPVRHFLQDSAFFARDALTRGELFFKSQERLARRALQLIDVSTLVSTDGMHDLIRDTIDLGAVRGNKDRALVIAATNWEEGDVRLFGNVKPEGALADLKPLDDKIGHLAILASAAIPGVFPPVEINHTKYVDGGLLMNTPLWPAIKALRAVAPDDAEYVVHVIYLDPDLRDVPLDQGPNTLDTLNRSAALAFASQVNRDIKEAKHVNVALELLQAAEQRTQAFADGGQMILASLPEAARTDVRHLLGTALRDLQKPFKALMRSEGANYRPLTIHRYHPRTTLGGVFGLLSFETGYVSALIDQGFQDAVTHDCEESGCIFPTFRHLEAARERCRLKRAAAGPS